MTLQRRPLGCMTGIALLFGSLTVILVMAAAIATGNGIFAPGPLNAETGSAALGGVTSHADLAGRCDACHTQAWSAARMADQCLICHASVADELGAGTGLHGRFATSGQCRGCHTEHGGAAAALTVANPASFPHERTGFWLDAHPVAQRLGAFACADCHTDSVSTFATGTCLACHRELDAGYMGEHVDTFGLTCRACHDGRDTYGEDFDHAAWKLDGAHATASCGQCHAGSTTLKALEDTPADCASCHAQDDIHSGRLGADCASCHTAASWQDAPASFDHGRTAFALEGGHASVDCLACHVDRAWTGIGTTCESCHAADDPHDGQFDAPCASCHTPADWTELTFDHATTRFRLVGAHAKPACAACHEDGRFAGTPLACVACHRPDDRHEGNLGSRCEACHRVTEWSDTTFRHDQADFRLTGAHVAALCSKCHASLTEYRGTPTSCVSCHRSDDAHEGSLGTGCARCHTTKAWLPATFDHSTTGFKLTGAHASTACAKCHPGGTFTGTPTACYACHAQDDAHDGGFGTRCGACHSTKNWSEASIDHSKTAFPLTGAHRSVACAKCHANNVFSGTPTACNACHSKPATHQPDAFSNCRSCHTTGAWKPADFNHAHSFPMGHRNANGVCTKCHASSWAVYTCSKCHPSALMGEHHKEVPGYSSTTCAKCHPTGQGF